MQTVLKMQDIIYEAESKSTVLIIFITIQNPNPNRLPVITPISIQPNQCTEIQNATRHETKLLSSMHPHHIT